MEYEGKGGRNNHSEEINTKNWKNTPFYLVCHPCNHHGEKNELFCIKCGEKMYIKSQMLRLDKNGNIKF